MQAGYEQMRLELSYIFDELRTLTAEGR